jgi:hypothetical protein
MLDKLRELMGDAATDGHALSPEEQAELRDKIVEAAREGRLSPKDVNRVLKTMGFLGVLSTQDAEKLGADLRQYTSAPPPEYQPKQIEPAGLGWRQVIFWLIVLAIAVLLWTLFKTT